MEVNPGFEGFRVIGITFPEAYSDPAEEARHISEFLVSGALDLIHYRKPFVSEEYAVRVIESLPRSLHSKLILHSHYNLLDNYDFGGYHFKPSASDFPDHLKTPKGDTSIISRSCHSISDFQENTAIPFSYSFLSPIFDSISKEGYGAKFDINDPDLLNNNRICPTIALGGVIPDFFEKLFNSKFAGAALLGYLWSPKTLIGDKIKVILSQRENIHNYK